jgi:hypothetical protein
LQNAGVQKAILLPGHGPFLATHAALGARVCVSRPGIMPYTSS